MGIRADTGGRPALSKSGLVALAFALAAAAPAAAGDGADGRFEKRTSSHFVLYQDVALDEHHGIRGSRRFEQDVLAVLEAAYDRLDAMLGLRPERPIVVVVYDPGIFDANYAGAFRFAAAGFYGDSIHIRGDTVVSPQLVRVLHHELVHAAFDSLRPALVLPAWFNEGMAEWFEARAAGKRGPNGAEWSYLASAAQGGGLPSLAALSTSSFGHLGPERASLAYLQSYAFVSFLAREHGERRLRDLCREVLRTGHLERSVRKTFRADLARLETRFIEYLGGSARR